MTDIIFDLRHDRFIPMLVTDAEPVVIPTHQADAKGNFGRVEYTARHFVREATPEEVKRWRFGE